MHGTALAGMGQAKDGLMQVRQGIDAYQGLNTPPVFWPMLIFMEAEVCSLAGKSEQGLAVLDQVFTSIRPGNEDAFMTDFYRLKGDLLLAHSPDKPSEAEFFYLRALESAQGLQANMLELRAAIRLCRLWQDQGKAEGGRQILSKAYDRFTEGFATVDLVEARALLMTPKNQTTG
jgi:predicted ATPase